MSNAIQTLAASPALPPRSPSTHLQMIELLFQRAICYHALGYIGKAVNDYGNCLGFVKVWCSTNNFIYFEQNPVAPVVSVVLHGCCHRPFLHQKCLEEICSWKRGATQLLAVCLLVSRTATLQSVASLYNASKR